MGSISDTGLISLLCFLILLGGFFSLSETGMMSLNRYRLRHLVRHKHRKAKRVLKLIESPDRLLGLVLIGNTFANILASAVFTVLAIRLWGEPSVGFATIALTLLVLIFGEIAPKTVAVLYPLRIALILSGPIKILLTLFYPLVWIMNKLSNGFLRLLGVKMHKSLNEVLNPDEFRSLVHEAGAILPSDHKNMLLSLLDLEKLTVDDIRVPKGNIKGIDLAWESERIIYEITHSVHLFLPVYHEHIDDVKGMLKMRDVFPRLHQKVLTKENILQILQPIYFIPEGTPVVTQLLNFRREAQRCGLVVDEYGDIQGLLTIEDILEEVVGEFASPFVFQPHPIELQKEGGYIVNGSINLRDLNRRKEWHFPVDGPKTLSGLIVERLEFIPPIGFCLKVGNYHLEIVSVQENKVTKVKVNF